ISGAENCHVDVHGSAQGRPRREIVAAGLEPIAEGGVIFHCATVVGVPTRELGSTLWASPAPPPPTTTTSKTSSRLPLGYLRRPAPGDGAGAAANRSARHEPAAAWVVEVEQSPDQLAGGEQPWNRPAVQVDHAPVGVYLH